MSLNIGLCSIRNSKKMPMDFLDNANKTSVFVSGWFYTQKDFVLSLDPSSKYLTDVSGLEHALRWVGRVSMATIAIVAGRVWNSKNWNLLALLSRSLRRNHETTNRRNDETSKLRNNETTKRWDDETSSKRLICRQYHHSGIVLVGKRSFFRFVQEFRHLAVSMRPSHKKRKFICVK